MWENIDSPLIAIVLANACAGLACAWGLARWVSRKEEGDAAMRAKTKPFSCSA